MGKEAAIFDRLAAGSCGVILLLYAIISGIGGPPSVFREDPPWLAAVLSGGLFVFYGGGCLLALGGIIASAFHATLGRWCCTLSGLVSATGNIVSGFIGAGHDGRAAFWLAQGVVPLLLLVWLPHIIIRVHERRRQGR